MEENVLVQVIRCKNCQFYRDNGDNYQYCTFWSSGSDDTFEEAMTEPDGYCHNALLDKRSIGR